MNEKKNKCIQTKMKQKMCTNKLKEIDVLMAVKKTHITLSLRHFLPPLMLLHHLRFSNSMVEVS